MIKSVIKKGVYYDSVSLMLVAREINKMPGIEDASVVMGTRENIAILQNAGLLTSDITTAGDTDLLLIVKATDENQANQALAAVDALLNDLRHKKSAQTQVPINSLEAALKAMPDAGLSLISIAGKYAAAEAYKALDNNLHVMIFSDNVSIEDELTLKLMGEKKGLLVMGPDCGTAIINGIPLAFANVVNRGNIGIVGASGTGIQEVTTIISKHGGGISQAIGTGGRDVKKEIGGIMFINALKALAEDPQTEVICLVSKPPHEDVLHKINTALGAVKKPIIAMFIGATREVVEPSGAIYAENLEEAALFAVALAKGNTIDAAKAFIEGRRKEMALQAITLSKKIITGKYVRGLFSGGTLCDEAQLIMRHNNVYTYSNTPLHPAYKLENVWQSKAHTILDLGDDEFTAGRPHPMIDFSLRNKRISDEAADPETAIVLFDVVLGYGSHLHPEEELAPVIINAAHKNQGVIFVCSVTGTDNDPQNYSKVVQALENAGVVVMPSNVAASELCVHIIKQLNN
ncbi:MAG: Succinyl-CoA ligase (ADP-forming) subunit alpha [Bacteroidetes bacterium ADurb.Bin408]|nr:MAG: Succinyl-CoA ligase (ADP-forming) subunit alpha [Bacteroidetes bacterium ADurb.Bin408]